MNGLLLDFLISNKPMTTRLYRFGVLLEQPTKWGQVEAEVYTLSSNCWRRVETLWDQMLQSPISGLVRMLHLLVGLSLVAR